MHKSPPPSGYERLTISIDVETSLLEDMSVPLLTKLLTREAEEKIKHMIEVRKNA